MTGGELIREVSLDLNDQEPGHEYIRWTVPQLQSYMREALYELGEYFGHWFLDRIVVPVVPGADWQTACSCTDIIRIVGESTRNGRVKRHLSRSMDIDENVWAGDVWDACSLGGAYTMESYAISGTDEAMFRVYPPVPPGESQRYVLVECYARPSGNIADVIPVRAVSLVKQWMLYRALAIDSENNATITKLAEQHKQTYFDLLKLAMAKQQAEEQQRDSLRTREDKATK